jgi:hypothetical protein
MATKTAVSKVLLDMASQHIGNRQYVIAIIGVKCQRRNYSQAEGENTFDEE